MDNNLYVGNLSPDILKDDLKNLFEIWGQVRATKVIVDRDTGISREFGFVEMVDAEDAKRAVSRVNGQLMRGRRLVVKKARPREEPSLQPL